MKLLYVAAAAAMAFMASCSGSNQKADENAAADAATATETQDIVYTGILPSADAAGIRYSLTLDYGDGDYELTETYLDFDSVSPSGYKDGQAFKSEGNFTVEDATPATAGKKHLRLISKAAENASPDTLYFLIDSDSAITLVGADLQPSETPGLNYTLTQGE